MASNSSSGTTTWTTTRLKPFIWFDPEYFKTTSGLVKVIATGINLIGFICSAVGDCNIHCGSVSFFSTVSMFAFWVTLILLSFYLFHLVEKLPNIPWIVVEFIYCCVLTLFYFIASLLIIFKGQTFVAAGFFGLLATALYALDAYLKYKSHISNEIAQGDPNATTPKV